MTNDRLEASHERRAAGAGAQLGCDHVTTEMYVYLAGLLRWPIDACRVLDLVKPRRELIEPRVEVRLVEIDRVAPDWSRDRR